MKFIQIALEFFKAVAGFVSDLVSRVTRAQNIRTKLIAAFMVPILLIIVLGIISYNSTTNAVRTVASESAISTMNSAEKYLSVIFTSIDDMSFQLFFEDDFQNYLSGNSTDSDGTDLLANLRLQRDVTQRLTTATIGNNNIANAFVFANENRSIFPINYPMPLENLGTIKESEFYKRAAEAKGQLVWLGFHSSIDKYSSTKEINYGISAVRIINDKSTNKPVGIAIFDLKLDVMQKILDDLKFGGDVHLVSPDGRDLASLEKTDKQIDNKIKITDQEFYKNIVAGKAQQGSDSITYNGVSYLMTYSKIGESGYTLIGLIKSSNLNSSAKQIILTTIIFVVVATLLAFGIGYFMATGMSRTINRIIKAAKQAASGDLTVRPVSRRRDELGALTKSINAMVSSMRSLIEQTFEISKKVADSALTVSSTSEQVSAVSHDISRAIQEISQGASTQAADAEQSVEKMCILAEKINSATESAKVIDSLTKNTMDMTHNGLRSIEDLNKKANETTAIAKEILRDIQGLDSHSKSIGKIVKVISGIADQTNLLALNATIEAARAGEMGKGFAVVADEVRKLAEQSMKATREIASIIKETQNQTAKAVEKAISTEAILKSQNEAVIETVNVFKTIKASMETLSTQVEQIVSGIVEMEENKEYAINAIQNISSVSEETAASSEEVTASTQEQLSSIEELSNFAQELGNAAKELENSISMFTLN